MASGIPFLLALECRINVVFGTPYFDSSALILPRLVDAAKPAAQPHAQIEVHASVRAYMYADVRNMVYTCGFAQ